MPATSSSARSQRALRRTLFWGLCFGIPLAVLAYFKLQYAADNHISSFGEIKPFYLTLSDGQSLTNHDLRQKVTLVLLSSSADLELSVPEAQTLSRLTSWAKENLQGKDPDEQAFRLIFISQGNATPASPLLAWQQALRVDADTMAAFLPSGHSLTSSPLLMMIDHNTEIRGVYPLAEASSASLSRTLARLNFNHYLNDYLSKRTFFGPRRA